MLAQNGRRLGSAGRSSCHGCPTVSAVSYVNDGEHLQHVNNSLILSRGLVNLRIVLQLRSTLPALPLRSLSPSSGPHKRIFLALVYLRHARTCIRVDLNGLTVSCHSLFVIQLETRHCIVVRPALLLQLSRRWHHIVGMRRLEVEDASC